MGANHGVELDASRAVSTRRNAAGFRALLRAADALLAVILLGGLSAWRFGADWAMRSSRLAFGFLLCSRWSGFGARVHFAGVSSASAIRSMNRSSSVDGLPRPDSADERIANRFR
jgi:hypothetical protein